MSQGHFSNLTSCDFFLFLRLRRPMKRHYIATIEDISRWESSKAHRKVQTKNKTASRIRKEGGKQEINFHRKIKINFIFLFFSCMSAY